jgi:hypothetical protein
LRRKIKVLTNFQIANSGQRRHAYQAKLSTNRAGKLLVGPLKR